MKVALKNENDSTWFIVAVEDEFSSNKHNVLYSGIGKVNAAMATQWLIDNYSVKKIINIGTAGGNPNKVESGKLCSIGKVFDRDWNFSNVACCEIAVKNDITQEVKNCYTGDSFVTDWNNDYELVDMEAYAIAKVCKENNINFNCYKYISDTGSDNEWEASLEKCNKVFNEIFE